MTIEIVNEKFGKRLFTKRVNGFQICVQSA